MRAAIYTRISEDKKGERLGVTRQQEDCAALADRLGWEVVDHFDDNDLSAFSGKTRPGFEAMLDAIKHGEVDAIVCWHPDRLYRTLKDLVRLLDVASDTQIRTVNGGDIDLSTSTGKMLATILGSVAAQESEHKSERQKAANRQRAENGNPWVRRAFGYTCQVDRDTVIERAKARAAEAGRAWTDEDEEAAWNPLTDKHANQLVPHESEMIRQAYKDVVQGASLYSVSQEWNKAGVTTPRGNLWTGGTVRQVLMNPRNAGLAVHQGNILEGRTVKWPAIVERDEWQALVDHLTDPKRRPAKSQGRQYLLTGIALCGACGKTLSSNVRPRKSGGTRPIYYCKRPNCMKIARTMSLVDDLVIDMITERLAQPNAAELLSPPTVDKKEIRDEVNNLRVRMTTTREHWLAERISDEEWFAKRDSLQNMLDVAESKLLDSNRSRTLDGLVGQPDARNKFDALNLDRRRAVVDCLATITIESSVRKGAPFDPKLITLVWKTG